MDLHILDHQTFLRVGTVEADGSERETVSLLKNKYSVDTNPIIVDAKLSEQILLDSSEIMERLKVIISFLINQSMFPINYID